jgi:hypothetical protein
LVPESDIRIDSDGVWFYRGMEMVRSEIIALFYQHLRQDDSGGYFIEIGPQRYPVHVEDTAFVVRSLHWAGGRNGMEECAFVLLSDNTLEKLNPETLRIGRNHIPYCRIKNQRFEARFSRASYYRLAEHLQFDSSDNSYFISINGRHYCLGNECLE